MQDGTQGGVDAVRTDQGVAGGFLQRAVRALEMATAWVQMRLNYAAILAGR